MTLRFLYAASASVLLLAGVASADDATLPGNGFTVARYEALWTKSPFSVATPEDPVASPDYSLVGLFRIDGVSYVNVIDKQSGEHFIVTSDKPARGLTLVSISRSQGSGDASAIMKKDTGEAITLKLEESAQPVMEPQEAPQMPWGGGGRGGWGGNGGGGAGGGGGGGGQNPPPVRMRPHLIHLPPTTGAATPTAPATQPAPAATN